MEEWGSPLEALTGQREELRAQIQELREVTREQQRLASQLRSHAHSGLSQHRGQGQQQLKKGGREHSSSWAHPSAPKGTERLIRGLESSSGASPDLPFAAYQDGLPVEGFGGPAGVGFASGAHGYALGSQHSPSLLPSISDPLAHPLAAFLVAQFPGDSRKGPDAGAGAEQRLVPVFAFKDMVTKAGAKLVSSASAAAPMPALTLGGASSKKLAAPGEVKEFLAEQRQRLQQLLKDAALCLAHQAREDGTSGPHAPAPPGPGLHSLGLSAPALAAADASSGEVAHGPTSGTPPTKEGSPASRRGNGGADGVPVETEQLPACAQGGLALEAAEACAREAGEARGDRAEPDRRGSEQEKGAEQSRADGLEAGAGGTEAEAAHVARPVGGVASENQPAVPGQEQQTSEQQTTETQQKTDQQMTGTQQISEQQKTERQETDVGREMRSNRADVSHPSPKEDGAGRKSKGEGQGRSPTEEGGEEGEEEEDEEAAHPAPDPASRDDATPEPWSRFLDSCMQEAEAILDAQGPALGPALGPAPGPAPGPPHGQGQQGQGQAQGVQAGGQGQGRGAGSLEASASALEPPPTLLTTAGVGTRGAPPASPGRLGAEGSGASAEAVPGAEGGVLEEKKGPPGLEGLPGQEGLSGQEGLAGEKVYLATEGAPGRTLDACAAVEAATASLQTQGVSFRNMDALVLALLRVCVQPHTREDTGSEPSGPGLQPPMPARRRMEWGSVLHLLVACFKLALDQRQTSLLRLLLRLLAVLPLEEFSEDVARLRPLLSLLQRLASSRTSWACPPSCLVQRQHMERLQASEWGVASGAGPGLRVPLHRLAVAVVQRWRQWLSGPREAVQEGGSNRATGEDHGRGHASELEASPKAFRSKWAHGMPGMKGSKAPSGLSLRWRPGKKLSERRKYVSGVMLAAQMQGLARRRQPGQPLPPMRNNQLPALAPKALPSTALDGGTSSLGRRQSDAGSTGAHQGTLLVQYTNVEQRQQQQQLLGTRRAQPLSTDDIQKAKKQRQIAQELQRLQQKRGGDSANAGADAGASNGMGPQSGSLGSIADTARLRGMARNTRSDNQVPVRRGANAQEGRREGTGRVPAAAGPRGIRGPPPGHANPDTVHAPLRTQPAAPAPAQPQEIRSLPWLCPPELEPVPSLVTGDPVSTGEWSVERREQEAREAAMATSASQAAPPLALASSDPGSGAPDSASDSGAGVENRSGLEAAEHQTEQGRAAPETAAAAPSEDRGAVGVPVAEATVPAQARTLNEGVPGGFPAKDTEERIERGRALATAEDGPGQAAAAGASELGDRAEPEALHATEKAPLNASGGAAVVQGPAEADDLVQSQETLVGEDSGGAALADGDATMTARGEATVEAEALTEGGEAGGLGQKQGAEEERGADGESRWVEAEGGGVEAERGATEAGGKGAESEEGGEGEVEEEYPDGDWRWSPFEPLLAVDVGDFTDDSFTPPIPTSQGPPAHYPTPVYPAAMTGAGLTAPMGHFYEGEQPYPVQGGAYAQGPSVQGDYEQASYVRVPYEKGRYVQGASNQGMYIQYTYQQGDYPESSYVEGSSIQGTPNGGQDGAQWQHGAQQIPGSYAGGQPFPEASTYTAQGSGEHYSHGYTHGLQANSTVDPSSLAKPHSHGYHQGSYSGGSLEQQHGWAMTATQGSAYGEDMAAQSASQYASHDYVYGNGCAPDQPSSSPFSSRNGFDGAHGSW